MYIDPPKQYRTSLVTRFVSKLTFRRKDADADLGLDKLYSEEVHNIDRPHPLCKCGGGAGYSFCTALEEELELDELAATGQELGEGVMHCST